MGQDGNVYWFLVGKPEGKRLLTRPVSRCEKKNDLNNRTACGRDSSGSEEGPVASSRQHGHECPAPIKCAEGLQQLRNY